MAVATAPSRPALFANRYYFYFYGMRVVVPQTIQFGLVRRSVRDHKPITQRQRFAGRNFHITGLLRREVAPGDRVEVRWDGGSAPARVSELPLVPNGG